MHKIYRRMHFVNVRIARVLTGYSQGTHRVLTGYSQGTHRVLTGYSQGTLWIIAPSELWIFLRFQVTGLAAWGFFAPCSSAVYPHFLDCSVHSSTGVVFFIFYYLGILFSRPPSYRCIVGMRHGVGESRCLKDRCL